MGDPRRSGASHARCWGPTMKISSGLLIRRALPFALALGIWFSPVPAGLTAPAWHLFAVFVSAIAAVLVGAFPLLTSTMIAVAAVVLTGTITPAQAFGGFANASVLLVVIAFLVAQAVVKSGLGRRISLFMVSRFGRSSHGTRLQRSAHRCGDRAGLSEQHRAGRCPVSDCVCQWQKDRDRSRTILRGDVSAAI